MPGHRKSSRTLLVYLKRSVVSLVYSAPLETVYVQIVLLQINMRAFLEAKDELCGSCANS